jgi:signal transduction histidine kinase
LYAATGEALELNKFKAYPELANALRRRAESIVEKLEISVKQALPQADHLTFSELRDHIPQLLDRLAQGLEGADTSVSHRFVSENGEHGVCRYHQSFNLRELLIEYTLLRAIIAEEVAGALARTLELDEMVVLNAGVDVASRRAAVKFVEYQSHQIQANAEGQSKYLAFLSHDLRGALNGILLMLEVLKRELGASGQFASSLDDIALMKRSILDTVGAMDRFLHAEKFRKGIVEVKPTRFSMYPLAAELANQFSHQAAAKNVQIRIDVARCADLHTDRELLNVILQNLVGNAVKYSKHGTVLLIADSQADGVCRLRVQDEGPGIAPERIAQIFAPYQRGETHGQGGVGLGLSIARQAAELLQGRIWVESKLGEGSTFLLEFPSLKST